MTLISRSANIGLLYMQLDVTSSQLLVTDGVFRDKGFRQQLSDTVTSLLDLRVIPIFNENDAVSDRKAPYQVCNPLCLPLLRHLTFQLALQVVYDFLSSTCCSYLVGSYLIVIYHLIFLLLLLFLVLNNQWPW